MSFGTSPPSGELTPTSLEHREPPLAQLGGSSTAIAGSTTRSVRSTHGVNCTGCCSWKVHVKDGIVTWETQQTDYPSNGPGLPDYEPRGCPRGASFSWYTLLAAAGEVSLRARGSPRALAGRPRPSTPTRSTPGRGHRGGGVPPRSEQRGKGGFAGRRLAGGRWSSVAAAHVHTVKKYGPDRIAGFSPIPAMSMASYAGGARFLSLMGGVCLSFYDWYADLPPASPQNWGDQTDVPESADWWDAGYLMMWGSNMPMTRTPDAHFMTEARYRGQKTVVVSPDYSDHTKFADHWLPAQPGTDAALAMAMTHVILREFHVERAHPLLPGLRHAASPTCPSSIRLDEHATGTLRPGPVPEGIRPWLQTVRTPSGRPAVFDSDLSAHRRARTAAIGDRWGEAGEGRWNLRPGRHRRRRSTLLGDHEELFGGAASPASTSRRARAAASRRAGSAQSAAFR